MSEAVLDEVRALLRQAVAAAEPIRGLGDGRGTFLIDELRVQLRAAGLQRRAAASSGAQVTRFDEFWRAYPRRVDKAGCLRKWAANKLDAEADRIVAHVKAKASTQDWQKEGGRFIPMPATYLNQRRWEEELGAAAADLAWVQQAGFSNQFEAENAGCYQHNSHLFVNGGRWA